MPPMLISRSDFGVAELNGCLFAVGGGGGGVAERTVECFDLNKRVWEFKAPMIKNRDSLGVGVCNGHLYAVGGIDWDSVQISRSVERYDPIQDTWTLVRLIYFAYSHFWIRV